MMDNYTLIESKNPIKESVVRCPWSVVTEDDFNFMTYRATEFKIQNEIFLISQLATSNRQHALSGIAQLGLHNH